MGKDLTWCGNRNLWISHKVGGIECENPVNVMALHGCNKACVMAGSTRDFVIVDQLNPVLEDATLVA